MLKTRTRTILLGLLLTVGCSTASEPDALPFQDDESAVADNDEVITAAMAEPSGNAVSSATSDSTPLADVWESIGVEPALAACYSEIFENAGVTEIADLRDFASQSEKLSSADQIRLNDCVNSNAG